MTDDVSTRPSEPTGTPVGHTAPLQPSTATDGNGVGPSDGPRDGAGPGDGEADVLKRGFTWSVWLAENGIFVFTLVLITAAAIFVDGFLSVENFVSVFHRSATIGIVAVGMTFVVISGNYLDLSVVAQVATAGVVLMAFSPVYGIPAAMGIALALAFVYGLINGVAVGYFKANAVIVTLATTSIGVGLLRFLSGGTIFFGANDTLIYTFGRTRVGIIPLSALLFIAVTLAFAFLLTRTNFGFLIRSFGSSKSVTRLAGAQTGRVVVGAFLASAFGAMLAGFVQAAFVNQAVSSMAEGYEFRALAAIIIGGTSVFGGRGSVLRTFLGVIFVSVLANVLVLLGTPFPWQQVALGAMILLAVSVDALARKAGA